ncbi:MAG: UvrD-helicase domain-containing protein [Rhodobacteraceae bacterium]|nr:UvrD-helicase domain-containing protein [Paracoccaceae bacterium]
MQSTNNSPAFVEELNERQIEAVEAVDGPVLIVAGAGTGKTRTLTSRMAYIIECGLAEPHNILAVTFTNRAANELKERVEAITGISRVRLRWVGTFHSMCARILRYEAERVGLAPNFTIYNSDDQLRTIKQLLKAKNITSEDWTPREFKSKIDKWKNDGLFPDDLDDRDWRHPGGLAIRLYSAYQEILRKSNAADFGDLILHVVKLFSENDAVLEKYQNMLRYLLVDEYQDTNIAQYKWLRLLALGHRNICCVGDDDQAIYSWRGARPRIMLEFENQFPGAKIVKLERNYRSTRHILGAAVGLIQHNIDRHPKVLEPGIPDDGDARKVDVVSTASDQEEAGFVARGIETLLGKSGKSPYCSGSDIAVASRTWARLAEIEQKLVDHGIGYRVIGGSRFYDRKEIMDAMAYLRLCHNVHDGAAFDRVVNFPARGIGAMSLAKIREIATRNGLSLMDSARQLAGSAEVSTRMASAVERFVTLIDHWTWQLTKLNSGGAPNAEGAAEMPASLSEVVSDFLKDTGMIDFYERIDNEDSRVRLENLVQFAEFSGRHPSLEMFIEHVGLMNQEARHGAKEREQQVSLMTLHAAKGSEFKVVYLVGWEEGQLPSGRAISGDWNSELNMSGERRLIERVARLPKQPSSDQLNSVLKSLNLTASKSGRAKMSRLGSILQLSASSWSTPPKPAEIDETRRTAWDMLGLEALEEERRLAHVGITRAKEICIISHAESTMRFGYIQVALRSQFLGELPGRHIKHWKTSSFSLSAVPDAPDGGFAIGIRVQHKVFGMGTVIAEGQEYSTVKFDSGRKKNLLNSYLTICQGGRRSGGQLVLDS